MSCERLTYRLERKGIIVTDVDGLRELSLDHIVLHGRSVYVSIKLSMGLTYLSLTAEFATSSKCRARLPRPKPRQTMK